MLNLFEEELLSLETRLERRSLRGFHSDGILIQDEGGKSTINFCSNNYLGLAQHPLLKEQAAKYALKYGVGATASRLICGNHPLYTQIEQRLAAWMGREAALILNSGFQANMTLLPALVGRSGHLFLDYACHNSLIQGAKASQATMHRFRHQDLIQLDAMLHKVTCSVKVIVTESIFSMSGDMTDLDNLAAIAKRHQALLVVDDAHGVGVLGQGGRGLAGTHPAVDIVTGGFGKAFGAFGGYLLCSQMMKEYLIQKCSGLIYSTALPPPVLGAISAALALVPDMDQERKELAEKSMYLRQALKEPAGSHIIPIQMESSQAALAASAALEAQGILALAIRPPTVPKACLRVSVSVLHTWEQLVSLVKCL